jgi:hypothetical protein
MTVRESAALMRVLDIREIENLLGRYLYLVQAHDYDSILDLFSSRDDVSAEIGESGVYEGPGKVRALFVGLLKPLFTSPGSLPIHMATTPVIEVEADGRHADGMWQTIGCNAFPGETGLTATWQVGKYDNRFVKEAGRWKFLRFRWLVHFRTSFDQGWVRQPLAQVTPLDITRFPAELHPTRPGIPHPPYNPAVPMDFGPLPPAPPPVRE